jgi:hypothetical protein
MSVSGAGLYDDDVAADVRSIFREAVGDGATPEEATLQTVAEWGDLLDDPDQGCPFWLALADTQSRTGRLLDDVRDRALAIIANGSDLARFDHDARLHRRRAIVLEELAARLTGPQRAPARIRRAFREASPVAPGDVFSYWLPDERVVYLRCAAVIDMGGSTVPIVQVLAWSGHGSPTDPRNLVVVEPRGAMSPRLWLQRRSPRTPDPAARITHIASGTPGSSQELPADVVEWSDLADVLDRSFW